MGIRNSNEWLRPEIGFNEKVTDNFLSVKEVAELLGISTTAVHNIINEGGIKVGTKGKDTKKIYPHALREIIAHRGWKIKFPKVRQAAHAVKGGVGKTSIIHTLACRYAAYGLRTLVIDIDKQANFTNSLGIDDEKDSLVTMLDLFKDYVNDREGYDPSIGIQEVSDFLHVITSDVEMTSLDLEITNAKVNVGTLFKNMLEPIEDRYDAILFDMAGEFNFVSTAVHCYVDTCIIPVNITQFSEKGLKLTYDHVSVVEKEYEKGPKICILPNKVKTTSVTHLKRISELTNIYGDSVSDTLVPLCPPFETCFDKGTNVWQNTRTRPVTNTIDDLAWWLADLDSISDQVKKQMAKQKKKRSKSLVAAGEVHA